MNNTARNLEVYLDQPQQDLRKNNNPAKKIAFSAKEKILVGILAVVTLFMMLFLISEKVSITVSQQRLQKVNTSVELITSKNVDLRQEIGELTSSARLTEYAHKHGMTLSDKNVRNVSK